ncbi:MAG: lipid-A-disaccharide synthase [Pseudomonadota bacterium]
MTRIMIVAGEASGDLHGANLVRAAQALAPGLDFYGVGGRNLGAAGVELLYGLDYMALMGLTEVISGLGRAWEVMSALKKSLRRDRPAALVLIDYPDFNLFLARTAKREGVPVFYYICPQIWAWRTGRIRKMARLTDRRVVVFPFEVDFYRKYGVTAEFVGHPLLDVMPAPRPKPLVKAELGFDPKKPLLLLLPGSRKQTARLLLPVMTACAGRLKKRFPALQLALAQADTLDRSFLDPFLVRGGLDVAVLPHRSHLLQNAADLALTVSGTSTLETALMRTPMVVLYRMNPLTFFLGRLLVKVDHVAMPNLIAGRRAAPELLQHDAVPDKITPLLEELLTDPGVGEEMARSWDLVRERLGGPGAGRRAAEILLAAAGLGNTSGTII